MDVINLSAVRWGSENALGRLIDKYTAYVCVVIRNTAGDGVSHEDVEEIASDVFFALWVNAYKVKNLKAWLGTTARNKALNKLRKTGKDMPLNDDVNPVEDDKIDDAIIRREKEHAVHTSVLALNERDQEIFRRHYYCEETITVISTEVGMTESAVKQRLSRGRKKLRAVLEKEGVTV